VVLSGDLLSDQCRCTVFALAASVAGTAGRTTEPAVLQPNQHTHLGLPVCRVVNDSQGLNLRGCEMEGERRQWKYVREIPNTK
jgi:hypothetical protein